MWLHRNELSRDGKRLRSLYESLREELEYHLIERSLVESYARFLKAKEPYPFVEKRELKPRAKVMERENPLSNGFIVLFTEDSIAQEKKKYVRFFEDNKVTKENLSELKLTGLNISDRFQAQQKYFDTARFHDLVKSLLPVDYALLIQKDNSIKHKNRFSLSHFHVRIDWLLDSAAESLGKELRYISKDLYEKGDDYAQLMVEKLFEYYSFHHTVSGRRTAAVLAAQLMKDVSFLSTIYVASSESRTLTKYFSRAINKCALIKLNRQAIRMIEEHPNGDPDFRKNFLIHETNQFGVSVFKVIYTFNDHSKPPSDGKLRELKPDVQWLKVKNQLLVPKISASGSSPIKYQVMYDQADPLT